MDMTDLEIHEKHVDEIISLFEKEPYASFLGIKLVSLGPGSAVAEVAVQKHMLNSHGTAHGAVIFALADYAFAAACNSYGRTAVGLNTVVNFMSPGKCGAVLRASAEEVKRNYRTAWYHITVESEGEIIASMEAMCYRKSEYFVGL